MALRESALNRPFLASGWGVTMKLPPSKRYFLLLIILSLAWIVSACSEAPVGELSNVPEGVFPVDPFFRELYDTLGGA